MNLPLIIIGAGGHARVLASVLERVQWPLLGMTDLSPEECIPPAGVTLLGRDDAVERWFPAEVALVNGIGSVASTAKRQGVFVRFKRLGYAFATVVDPLAILAGNVELGEGAQVMAGAVIQSGAAIGENTIVNTGVIVDHDCRIGAHVHLASGVTLSGEITIGVGCHLGTGASVIQGRSLGEGCLVAAGAVVVKDVPPGATVMGIPARRVDR